MVGDIFLIGELVWDSCHSEIWGMIDSLISELELAESICLCSSAGKFCQLAMTEMTKVLSVFSSHVVSRYQIAKIGYGLESAYGIPVNLYDTQSNQQKVAY